MSMAIIYSALADHMSVITQTTLRFLLRQRLIQNTKDIYFLASQHVSLDCFIICGNLNSFAPQDVTPALSGCCEVLKWFEKLSPRRWYHSRFIHSWTQEINYKNIENWQYAHKVFKKNLFSCWLVLLTVPWLDNYFLL